MWDEMGASGSMSGGVVLCRPYLRKASFQILLEAQPSHSHKHNYEFLSILIFGHLLFKFVS
jgi:hypothetical protein